MSRNLRQIDLNLLLLFDAMMQERNLSRAAKRLHMSQPAASNAMKRLREQLADPLFIRTGRGMLPTGRAHAVHGPIHQALGLLRTTLDQSEMPEPSAEIVYRLAMNDYGVASLLPRLYERIRSVAPNMILAVQRDDAVSLARRLSTAEVDLAIDYLHIDDPDLRYQPLREEQLVIISRAGHPVGAHGQVMLDQYQRFAHVAVPSRGERGSPLEIVMGSAKIRRRIKMYVPDYLAMPAIVAGSDLLATVPRGLADAFAASYGLAVFATPPEVPTVQINMIWHRQQDHSAGLRWLRDKLLEVVASDRGGRAGIGETS